MILVERPSIGSRIVVVTAASKASRLAVICETRSRLRRNAVTRHNLNKILAYSRDGNMVIYIRVYLQET